MPSPSTTYVQPLGGIAHDLYKQILTINNDSSISQIDEQTEYDRVWNSFDDKFQDRNDYRFWRCHATPFFWKQERNIPPQFKFTAPDLDCSLELFLNGAKEKRNLTELWGLLGASVYILHSALSKNKTQQDEYRCIPKILIQQLTSDLTSKTYLLSNYTRQFALIRLLLRWRCAQLTMLQKNKSLNFKVAHGLLNCIADELKIIDESWDDNNKQPKHLNLSRMHTTTNIGLHKVWSDLDHIEKGFIPEYKERIASTLIKNLSAIANIHINIASIDNSSAQWILDTKKKIAYSAWHLAQTYRIRQERFLNRDNLQNRKKEEWGLKIKKEIELRALMQAARCTLETGDNYNHSRLLHIFTHITPEYIAKDEKKLYRLGFRTRYYRAIKEVGLSVPETFESRHEKEKAHEETEDDARSEMAPDSTKAVRRRTIADLYISNDAEDNDDWTTLLSYLPEDERPEPGDPGWYNKIDWFVRKYVHPPETNIPLELQEILFRLLPQYARYRSAAKLLGEREYTPPVADLIAFVERLHRAISAVPLGLRLEKIEEWQDWISNAWARMNGHANSRERLLLHELLVGKFSHLRHSLPNRAQRLVYQRYQGAINAESLRTIYKHSDLVHFEAPPPKKIHEVAGAINANCFCDSPNASPVAVSVYPIPSTEKISVIVIGGGNREHVSWEFKQPEVEKQARRTSINYRNWVSSSGLHIEWPEALKTLAKEILREADEARRGFRSLLLAIPPTLANLPWQDLLCEYSMKMFDRFVVVSIIPSMSFVARAFRWPRNTTEASPLVQHLSEEDEELVRARQSIITASKSLPENAKQSADTAILLGHGNISADQELPNIFINGEAFGGDELLELASNRFLAIYGCHGGSTRPSFLGGLGRLPGLALQMGARTILAPVAEIPPKAAIKLHEHLVKDEGRRPLIEAYQEAIEEESSVSLFQIYGSPFESLCGPLNQLPHNKRSCHQ